jgi:hypothetical protein
VENLSIKAWTLKIKFGQVRWLTPKILATWEVGIGSIMAWGQLSQKDSISQSVSQTCWCAPVILATMEAVDRTVAWCQPQAKPQHPSWEISNVKKGWRHENICLESTRPSTGKKKKKLDSIAAGNKTPCSMLRQEGILRNKIISIPSNRRGSLF